MELKYYRKDLENDELKDNLDKNDEMGNEIGWTTPVMEDYDHLDEIMEEKNCMYRLRQYYESKVLHKTEVT